MDTRVSRDCKALLPSNDRRPRGAGEGAARGEARAARAARVSFAEGVVLLFAVGVAAPFGLGACFGAEFTFTTSTSGSGGAGGDGGTGEGGGGGGTPPGCIPSASVDPIGEDCGIHVSASLGADGNPGTRAQPYRTLGEALANADGQPIYVCGEVFQESVQVPAGSTIYGALACGDGWAYDVTRPTDLTAAAGEVPIKFLAGELGTGLQDFRVVAIDAVVAGGSSIAAIAEVVPLSLTRVVLQAGHAGAGRNGETPTDWVGPTEPDDETIRGNDGLDACMAVDQQLGGGAKFNDLCPQPTGPVGGAGGNGALTNGSNGNAIPADAQTALGGVGQPAVDPGMTWSCVVGGGAIGGNGSNGPPGIGAQGSAGLGMISGDGYIGVPGQPGGVGLPGQGGGGGGGAKGKTLCAGASGGSGGVGGCGGNGGSGGDAGGASIALISLGGSLTFVDSFLKTSSGGAGGDGGEGQVGGAGGLGGVGGIGEGTLNACDGGKGGQGGFGGKGGGGRGGHSIGLAYLGEMPSLEGVGFEIGIPGSGGIGEPGNGGDSGIAGNTQAF